MKSIFRTSLLAVSLLSTGVAFAGGKSKGEPNCEVKGVKKHMKDEKACTKKGGTWMAPAAAAPAAAAPVDAAAPVAAPEAAPAK